jgi:hypothetical protein
MQTGKYFDTDFEPTENSGYSLLGPLRYSVVRHKLPLAMEIFLRTIQGMIDFREKIKLFIFLHSNEFF